MNETKRYTWSQSGTELLVSIWSNEKIQNQMKAISRPQPIWNSIARFMTKRGFAVNGLQCKTRIKNMTRMYIDGVASGKFNEIVRPHYDTFQDILAKKAKFREEKSKRSQIGVTGIDIIEDENSADYSVEEVHLEDEEVEEENKAEENKSYCTVQSSELEELINRTTHAQTLVLQNLISDSMRSIERLVKTESERVMKAVAEEARHRRELELRLDRLMTRVEAAAVPQLTYMGA